MTMAAVRRTENTLPGFPDKTNHKESQLEHQRERN